MTITVIGTGFVGVVSASVFASFGHKVFGLDVDEVKIASLKNGLVPFFEPKLSELLSYDLQQGNLHFTTDYAECIPESDIVIVAVGTPSASDGTADLRYVFAAIESLASLLKNQSVLAIKSTVPPGTNQTIKDLLKKHTTNEVAIASLPEFLREGSAVDDTIYADRVVIGASEQWAIDQLLALHKPIAGERVIVAPESAQMAKYSANAYLALRITFANQIADLCEKTNANVEEVIRAIGPDKRIGTHYWYPGLGYGGSCFPKDVKELAAYSKRIGIKENLLIHIDQFNDARIEAKMLDFEHQIGGFKGKMVAVLGLAFKPNTNDMRVAPSLKVIPYLKERKAVVKVYDPKAMPDAKLLWPSIFYGTNVIETIREADVIIMLAEWDEFKNLDMAEIVQVVRPGAFIIDTRAVFKRTTVESYGLNYIGIGNT